MTVIMPFVSHENGAWPRQVRALVLARAVNQLGAFAMSFLAVALVQVYGASLVTAGWVVALFGLATVPSRLAGGRMADRVGRRPTIVIGLLGCAVALLVIAAAPGVGGAAAGAALLGLAFEIYEPPSQALLAELVAPARRPQAFGLLGAALAAAGVGAGILAVLLGGVSLRLLFVADAATCVAAAALILVWVREPPGARPATSGGSPWRDVRLLVMLGLGTGFAFAWNLSVTALPLTVAARGLRPAETGWLLAVAAVATIAGQRLLRGAAARPFFLMTAGLSSSPRDSRLSRSPRCCRCSAWAPSSSRLARCSFLDRRTPWWPASPTTAPARATSRRTAPAGASPRRSGRSPRPACWPSGCP